MMNARIESIFAVVAALLVLFVSMVDARISAGVSIILLLAIGVYKFMQYRHQTTGPS